MATSKITLAVGDELPVISAILSDVSGAIDLAGCTVAFETYTDAGAVSVSITCSVQAPTTAGHVHFSPSAALVTTAGKYRGRYKVTNGSAQDLHVPNDSYVDVYVS